MTASSLLLGFRRPAALLRRRRETLQLSFITLEVRFLFELPSERHEQLEHRNLVRVAGIFAQNTLILLVRVSRAVQGLKFLAQVEQQPKLLLRSRIKFQRKLIFVRGG